MTQYAATQKPFGIVLAASYFAIAKTLLLVIVSLVGLFFTIVNATTYKALSEFLSPFEELESELHYSPSEEEKAFLKELERRGSEIEKELARGPLKGLEGSQKMSPKFSSENPLKVTPADLLPPMVTVLFLAAAVFSGAAAWGLWMLIWWGRLLAIWISAITAFIIFFVPFAFLGKHTSLPVMFLVVAMIPADVRVIVYLFREDVKSLFAKGEA